MLCINLSCSTNRLECVYIVYVDKLTFSNIELFQCDLLYLCAKRKTKKIILYYLVIIMFIILYRLFISILSKNFVYMQYFT